MIPTLLAPLVFAAVLQQPAPDPAPAPGTPAGYLIHNVNVVDVAAGAIRAAQDVEISGEKIVRIMPSTPGGTLPTLRAGVMLEDGSGLYLMPGLFDAHVHLMMSPDTFAPLLLANGITCVRDTGAATAAILALRAAAAGGALMPQIVCTGAIVDGDPPVWPFSEACDTPEAARAAVQKLHAAGVDMIKVYSRLKKDAYLAAIDEAHTLGLKATGHVPSAVTLEEAMAAGQDGCEHLTGFDRVVAQLSGWKPPEGAQSMWAGMGAWTAFSRIPAEDLHAFARQVKASGMYQCPTLVVMQGVGRLADPEAAQRDPLLAYVPSRQQRFWAGPGYAAMAASAAAAVPGMQAMVGELARAGVPIMVGTDLANPYVFAGFSVHEEMKLMQEAGMKPAEVLRAATLVPATFCGLDKSLGSVQRDKVASLVLAGANPLENIANAAQVRGVFLRGRYLDRAALDAQLEEVRSLAAASRPHAQESPAP